ncbi:unnamed protein product [Moneuplotes crassus]|uniref:ALMS motif domain-containing protein n=1 Tax=Euplotes crassus TaxID=5936 RepID=A0AAD1UB34_EUPCR|nr:unnamed protein product [Moneuplotes crassus]
MFPTIEQEKKNQLNRSVSGELNRNHGFKKNMTAKTPNRLNTSHSGIQVLTKNANIINKAPYQPYHSTTFAQVLPNSSSSCLQIRDLESPLESIQGQIEQNRVKKFEEKRRDREIELYILSENRKQIKQEKVDGFKKKMQKSRYYQMLKHNYEMVKEKKRSMRKLEEHDNGVLIDKVPYMRSISPTNHDQNMKRSNNNISTISKGIVNLNLSYETKVPKSTVNHSIERNCSYLPQSWTEAEPTKQKLSNKRRSIEALRTALNSQLQEKKRMHQQNRQNDQMYFQTALKTDVSNLSSDKIRRDFMKLKEKKNLEFICLQMKERRKETLKNKGHMNIRVKIEDDYRNNHRIQSRNKAFHQALTGFTQKQPNRQSNFKRLG